MTSKYGGYMGKVLKINLTTQTVEDYPFSDRERELFIGGKMMAAKILGDHLTGQEKPFSEENLLVITTGPMTGAGAPSASRFNFSANGLYYFVQLRWKFRILFEESRLGCVDSARTV